MGIRCKARHCTGAPSAALHVGLGRVRPRGGIRQQSDMCSGHDSPGPRTLGACLGKLRKHRMMCGPRMFHSQVGIQNMLCACEVPLVPGPGKANLREEPSKSSGLASNMRRQLRSSANWGKKGGALFDSPAAGFPRLFSLAKTPVVPNNITMVSLVSGSASAESEPRAAPRHGSSERERLDVPDGGRSGLTGRLSMLHLGKDKDTATGVPSSSSSSSATGVGGKPSSGRSRWEAAEGGRRQEEGPSLMEQMMAEATAARQEKSKEQRKEQLRDTKGTFGGGLKKGFLSSQRAAAPARKGKSGGRKRRGEESSKPNSGGGCSPSTVPAAQEGMPVIAGRKASPGGGLEFDVSADGANRGTGLLLPEVQEAMKHAAGGGLGGAGGGGGGEGGQQGWLTPELLEKIAEKPRLAAMLADPRFSEAMKLMSTAPKEALGVFASSPEARESFTELMSLLSTHFTALGKEADEKAAAEEAERKRVAEGPLAREALRRAADGLGPAAAPATAEEEAKVERVLQQPELRELLTDPGMQRVMQECGDPQSLARYMRHPEYGPKLQLMARAGLISFRA